MSCTTFVLKNSHLLLIIILLTVPNIIESGTNTLADCPDRCGNITVPYPFGISTECSFKGFTLDCTTYQNGTSKLFLIINDIYIEDDIEVLDVSLSTAEARINNPVSQHCYNKTGNYAPQSDWAMDLTNYPYRFSDSRNKFITIGCETVAYISIRNSVNSYQSGCISVCSNLSLADLSCSGLGCCQTTIPKGISSYYVQFDRNFNNSDIYEFNPCSYAFLAEDSSFSFDTKYITTDALSGQQMPLVLDWAIRNETCNIALENPLSYMCKSENSVCLNSTNDVGYFCNCSLGYQGNPYLVGGCEDIDECADKNNNPCSKPAKCHNTVGGYRCSCPFGRRLNHHENCQLDAPVVIVLGIMIGISVCVALIIFAASMFIFTKRYKKRQMKVISENNFKRHFDIIYKKHPDTNRRLLFFRMEELEKATSKFDETLIVGQGGHGIIYKGILLDQRIVAVKKPKIEVEREIEEFLNEVAILSQLNHRNVVKLLGCCLESDVPMLIYEFISNGTLTDHLHVEEGQSLSWNDRLRIALEIAGALSYVHSAASISVFHRDIKTSNILLNDGFTAKLSDFGASRVVPIGDNTAGETNIQGTFGYLDPEYHQTGRLTAKSDVYSFGVILAELLTRRKPVSYIPNVGSLVAYFGYMVKENRLHEILDPQIVEEEHMAELESVAILAEKCVRTNGEERPTMKEVEMQLEVLWSSKHRSAYNRNREEQFEQQQSLLKNHQIGGDTSGACSLECESIMLSNFPR